MKRLLIIVLAVIILLLLGGAAWFFLSGKPARALTATDLAPASTSALLWLPHVPASLKNYKETPVYKMWRQEAVQAAFEKLKADNGNPVPEEGKKLWELADSLSGIFQGEAFIAITDFKAEPEPGVDAIGGFQIGSDPAAFKAWTDKVKAAFPQAKWEEKKHGAQTYYVTQLGDKEPKAIFSVTQWNDWVIVGLGLNDSAFIQLLDRAAAGKPDPLLTLGGQERFTKLVPKDGFDTLIYVDPAPLFAAAKKSLKKNPEQLKALQIYESMDGIVLTSSISGSDYKDTWNIRMPKEKRPDYGAAEQPVKGVTARFTTPQTLIYNVQNMDLPKYLNQIRSTGENERKMIDQGIAGINQGLAMIQVDFEKDIAAKLGPEVALSLDWVQGKPYPDLNFIIEHKDQAVLRKLLEFAVQIGTQMGGGQVQINSKEISGDPSCSVTIPMSPVSPGIWIGKNLMLITLNGPGIEAMVNRKGETLLDSKPYKDLQARSSIQKPATISYVDMENLVGYGHGSLATFMPMLSAMAGNPALADSLPPVETLKPYLGRWGLFSEMDAQGVRVEGVYEKGHPLIYMGVVGVLSADLLKAASKMAATAAASNVNAQPSAPAETESSGAEADPNMVLQDLVDLDEAISTLAKDKNLPEGTVVAWNDVAPFLPENSQVATRVGLDPLGNAYVLGKTGQAQVTLSAETAAHFKGAVPEKFWGKFAPQPAPAP